MTDDSKAVITEYNGIPTCFYFERDVLTEIFKDNDEVYETGDIFVGRVSNVRRDLKAAFVDIAPGVSCFLPFDEIGLSSEYCDVTAENIKQGDEIPVMITAQCQKNKPYKLSMKLSLQGLFCVAVSDENRIRISSKLAGETKDRVRALAESAAPKTGIIVRTESGAAPEEEVLSEIISLSDELHEILCNYRTRTVYSKIFAAKPSFYNRINELGPAEVITDSDVIFEKANNYISGKRSRISVYKDTLMPLYILYKLGTHYEEAASKKVNLKSGGFIVIEPTEALTVIDVNSGKFEKKSGKEQLIRQTNIEAAKEVFRQIRLRNLSGIIIVDFINIEDEDTVSQLKELMKTLALYDPVKTNFVDFTKLGLAEITRQKKYGSFK